MEQNFNNRVLLYNIIFTVVQIFLSAIILFFLYRLIITTVGVKQLGVWSLISTSITSLSILNYGFSGSLVKYISKYAILNNRQKVKELIETTLISVSVFSFILSIIGYFIFLLIIKHSISSGFYHNIALKILPICLITFWFTILSSIYQSVLEGLNLSFKKNILNIINYVIIIVLAYFLLPIYGLMGLAISYLISSIFLLFSSAYMALVNVPELSILNVKWSKETYKETLSYNSNYQLISIFAIFNEPVTKFVLARYGGLEISGIYEIANKLVLQVRGIIVNVNQTLVPMFSSFQESDKSKVELYFQKSFKIVLLAATIFFSTFLFFTPLFSLWWFKSINPNFIDYVIILSISWFINTISGTVYFANLGSGDLKWNTLTQVFMSIFNILLSLLFANLFYPQYIILGWATALFSASIILIIKYLQNNSISIISLISKADYIFLITSLIISTAGFYFIYKSVESENIQFVISVILIYSILQLVNLTLHPIFKEIKSIIVLKFKHE